MLNDSQLNKRIILLCNLLVAFSEGAALFFAGSAGHRGPGAGYTHATGWLFVASGLGATAASLIVSIMVSRRHNGAGRGIHVSSRTVIFLVMCVPICLCEYALFLQGRAFAIGRVLEWKIVNTAAIFGFYTFLLFSFYAILWRGLRQPDLPEAA